MKTADAEIIRQLNRIYDAQAGGGGAASFASLTGDPSDNAALDSALDAKGPVPSDTAYDATSWDGVTTIGPSKNSVRDKVEAVVTDIATKQTAAQVQTAIDIKVPYLVYTALLTQTGTDAPVATVLQNTLGGTVVWTYDSVGAYSATLSSAFTANKTWANIGQPPQNSAIGAASAYAVRSSNNVVQLNTYLSNTPFGGTSETNLANGILVEVTIEIRVYP